MMMMMILNSDTRTLALHQLTIHNSDTRTLALHQLTIINPRTAKVGSSRQLYIHTWVGLGRSLTPERPGSVQAPSGIKGHS